MLVNKDVRAKPAATIIKGTQCEGDDLGSGEEFRFMHAAVLAKENATVDPAAIQSNLATAPSKDAQLVAIEGQFGCFHFGD